jgi:hypothetical protein
VSRLPRPWIAAACALCLGPAPAIADGELERPAPSLRAQSTEVRSHPHTTAWSLLASGVVLDVGSFFLAERADESYQEYQHGIDPIAVDRAYDSSVRYDRWASATLIAGQVAIASGLYLLLVKKARSSDVGDRAAPPEPRLGLTGLGARGVALTLRF